jgi:hypothetical protein
MANGDRARILDLLEGAFLRRGGQGNGQRRRKAGKQGKRALHGISTEKLLIFALTRKFYSS